MHTSKISDDIQKKRTSFLKQVAIFAELEANDLEIISQKIVSRKYKKKEIIFHQGDDSHTLYLIAKGKVRIFSISPAGNETSFRIFSIGDIIGEFAAIDGKPRSTTAKAMDNCILLELQSSAFLDRIQQTPKLALGLIKHLVKKLRWTTDYAEMITHYDSAGRLLHIILHYNEMFGKEIDKDRRYELDLSLNQSDLASLVGIRREWVNRIFQDWRKKGFIKYEHGKIMILDLPAAEEERTRRLNTLAEDDRW
jgi:CRP-like cAMP-binding protein